MWISIDIVKTLCVLISITEMVLKFECEIHLNIENYEPQIRANFSI